MQNFNGTIIEESLESKEVLEKIKITSTEVDVVTERHQTPWLSQWTLRAVEIPENEVKEISEEISQSLEKEHSWYADFKNDNYHYIIFRDKVFCIDRKSKKQYDEAKRYGISLGIPEYQLINYQNLPLDVLAKFLGEANKNTYANVDAKKAASARLNSEDYHFEKDGLIYHDTYFGERDFIGEEIVYKDRKPAWGMNYYGFVFADEVNEKEVYGFLRKALMQKQNGIVPVRGPQEFSENNWAYKLSIDGDLARFNGQEEILLDGKIVYRLYLHGGFIQCD